jgi:hypothetical protein
VNENGTDKGMLRKVALPAAVAAAGAGIALLFTTKPKQLRGAIPGLEEGARELLSDLKQRVESLAHEGLPDAGAGGGSRPDLDELEARRRERQKRRERRRQRATT